MKINCVSGSNQNYTILNQNKNNNPQFGGMTKILKKKVYIDGKKDILEIIQKRGKEKNTLVGQLPPGIFYKLPKEKSQLSDAIHDIMSTFGEVANEIRPFVPGVSASASEHRNRRPDKSVNKLKDVFVKYNLIKEDADFDLQFLGRGDYGTAFKINGFHDDITNDDYILKVHTVANENKEWHRYKSHGNYAEPNTAVYWTHQWGKDTQRGKFYWADIRSGYMVDNFIDMNTPPYKNHVNEYTLGLKLTDEELGQNGHNKINNYSIDWGGVRVVNRIKNKSKTARAVLYKIKFEDRQFRDSKWWEIFEHRDRYDDLHKKAGLALAIKHMENKPKYIETCLDLNKPMVDRALAYVLKYLPHKQAIKYYGILMRRNDPKTQIVLMNEIPLLARKPLPEAYDDLDVPKDQIDSQKIKYYFDLSKKYALPEAYEHLASYVHLLPEKFIDQEFQELVARNDSATNDRLLHKLRAVPDTEFDLYKRIELLNYMAKNTADSETAKAAQKLSIQTLRKTLAD